MQPMRRNLPVATLLALLTALCSCASTQNRRASNTLESPKNRIFSAETESSPEKLPELSEAPNKLKKHLLSLKTKEEIAAEVRRLFDKWYSAPVLKDVASGIGPFRLSNVYRLLISIQKNPEHPPSEEWNNLFRGYQGVLTLMDKAAKEMGEFTDGTYNGKGSFTWSDGGRYKGDFKNGKLHGHGMFSFKDGRIYDGAWKESVREGYGIQTWPNGNFYIGDFKNDTMNGTGTYTWRNKEKYIGDYKNGKRDGHGTFTWPNGENYSGDYKNDEEEGKGTYTWPNGENYSGEFKAGKFEGHGIYTWPDGEKYRGDFKEDEREGNGVFQYINNDRYEGKWVGGRKEGWGTMRYEDNSTYVGEWESDVWSGSGTYSNNQVEIKGIWTAGLTQKQIGLLSSSREFTEEEINFRFPLNHKTYPNLTYAQVHLLLGSMNTFETLSKQFDLLSNKSQLSESRAAWQRAFEDFPKEDLWRLFIDHNKQSEGKDVFDISEPGYRAGMEKAFYYLQASLGHRLDIFEYILLHDLCVKGVKGKDGDLFTLGTEGGRRHYPLEPGRTGDRRISKRENAPPVTQGALDEWQAESLIRLDQDLVPPAGQAQYLAYWESRDGNVYSAVPKHFSRLRELIDDRINIYYNTIGTETPIDEKIRAIVRLCRALEIAHIFPDGNQRTIVFVLLNKLLIENKLSPVILPDPSVFDGYLSADELVDEVKKGWKNFSSLLRKAKPKNSLPAPSEYRAASSVP